MFDVVYFSSVSENTKRFVDKLGATAIRIPLKSEEAAEFAKGTPILQGEGNTVEVREIAKH